MRRSWSRRWEAAVGVALAHLVAVTEGHPVNLPVGPVAELLGHAVSRHLPAGAWRRSVGLAGPGIHSSPIPATGVLPEGVLRDDYSLPPRPRLPRYRDAHRQAVPPASAG